MPGGVGGQGGVFTYMQKCRVNVSRHCFVSPYLLIYNIVAGSRKVIHIHSHTQIQIYTWHHFWMRSHNQNQDLDWPSLCTHTRNVIAVSTAFTFSHTVPRTAYSKTEIDTELKTRRTRLTRERYK